jgi:hypothetical protein
MTAVPDPRAAGVQLICDGCGRAAAIDGCGFDDAGVVYVAAGMIGWSGSTFARGPHRCPGCPAGVSAAVALRHRGADAQRIRLRAVATRRR